MKYLATLAVLAVCILDSNPASAQLFRRARRCKPAACPCPKVVLAAPSCATSSPATAIGAMTASPKTASFVSPPMPTPAVPTSETPVAPAMPDPVEIVDQESVPSPSDVEAVGLLATDAGSESDSAEWKSLFDGKTMGDWIVSRFGGEGDVVVEDGQITCDFGQYITGITYKGKDLPTNNYEIELEAKRMDGGDFFCGLTFPVDDKHATFVVGGWGGSVTGISSIDSYDASENDTTDYMQFENNRWYKIRVRVTKDMLEAWIGKKKMVSKQVESSRLSTRIEVDPSKPLGVCCFDTQAGYRNIRIRRVSEPDEQPLE